MYFRQAVWDPLAKRELTVAEHEKSWGHVRAVPLVEDGVQAPEGAGADADDIEGFEELFNKA